MIQRTTMPRATSQIRLPAGPRAALLLLLGSLLLPLASVPEAEADTTLKVLGEGSVKELGHKREIQLSSGHMDVVETITFANPGNTDVEAVYGFSLPARAAIHGLSIDNPGGVTTRFGVVDAQAATRLVADPGGKASPDLGLLRMIGVQDSANSSRRYELRIFPVPGQLSSKVVLRWQSPVEVVAGRFSVHIPGRGSNNILSRSEVFLRTNMATTHLYGGGKELARSSRKNSQHRFFEPSEGDLVIQAMPKNSKVSAHAEVALYPLGPDSGIAAVRVTLPAAASKVVSRFSRVLLLVDVSRSMGEKGREAASQLVDGLLAEMGTGTEVEAILYDRHSTQVLGSLKAGSKENRATILAAIRASGGKNGSDLRGALELARKVLREGRSTARKDDTLLAVISDGVLPADLKGADAVFTLGPEVMADTKILSALLVPPTAPLPGLGSNPMSTLAYRGRGRVVAIRYQDAAQLGSRVLRGLTQPQPLRALTLELDRGSWVGANLKGTLGVGSSLLALGYYEKGVPRRVEVHALQGGADIVLKARKLSKKEGARWARMTLANTSPDSFPGADAPDENRRKFVKTASALGVITEVSAGIALDKADTFAGDRLALATRQGGQHYRRLAPPAETKAKTRSFRRFEVMARRGGRGFSHEETGKLDRKIIRRRMRSHAIPMARGCYDKLLRRDQEAAGKVLVRFELSRGEVHHVELPDLAFSLEPIRACIIDAVYAMPIPRVRQGSDQEQVNLVNYPLHFRLQKPGKGKVEEGKQPDLKGPIDISDPLDGLPE